MPLIAWNEKLSVGVASLDGEHRQLVQLLNEFYDATQAGHAKDALGEVLNRLVDYTKFHFANEEEFMVKTAYADYATHKKQHEDLTRQVLEVQKKYKNGALPKLPLEIMMFLKDWLLNHIQGTDKKYGPHFNGKGIH